MRKLPENVTVEFGKLAAMYRMQFTHAEAFLDVLENSFYYKDFPKEPEVSTSVNAKIRNKRYGKEAAAAVTSYLAEHKVLPFKEVVDFVVKRTGMKRHSAETTVHSMCQDGLLKKSRAGNLLLVALPLVKQDN